MRRIQNSIEIKAPVAEVYSFLTQPTNMPTVWPSLIEVSNVVTKPDGWHSFDWVYKMAGIRLHGHTDTVRCEKNSYVEAKTTGGVASVFQWKYEAIDGGTRLTCINEYTIPVPVLGKLAEAFVVKVNEHEAQTMLANIKLAVEELVRGDRAGDQRARV